MYSLLVKKITTKENKKYNIEKKIIKFFRNSLTFPECFFIAKIFLTFSSFLFFSICVTTMRFHVILPPSPLLGSSLRVGLPLSDQYAQVIRNGPQTSPLHPVVVSHPDAASHMHPKHACDMRCGGLFEEFGSAACWATNRNKNKILSLVISVLNIYYLFQ